MRRRSKRIGRKVNLIQSRKKLKKYLSEELNQDLIRLEEFLDTEEKRRFPIPRNLLVLLKRI
jgi:hypothetical protein